MNDPRYMNSAAASAADIDLGLRAYMLGVYNYMTTALALTGLFAYGTKMLSVTTGADGQMYLTGFGQLVLASPLMWVIAFAPLGMVFWISARMHAMSASKAKTLFYVF